MIEHAFRLYNQLNLLIGFGGTALVLPTHGGNLLLVNTAGLVLTLVGAILIYAAFDLENRAEIAFFTAVARLIFAG